MTAPAAVGTAATASALSRLDAAYRAGTANVSLAVARALLANWATVDARDLAGTSTTWLEQSVELALAGRRNAAQLANAYTQQVRMLSVPDAPRWAPPPPRPPNVEQIRNSFEYVAIKETARQLAALDSSLRRDVTPEDVEAAGELPDTESDERTRTGAQRQLMQKAIARAAAAAVRHVTEGGRDQIDDNVASDPVALGWARTTKPGCCYFCAMLGSRGFVYKEDSFEESDLRFHGPGQHKVHDSCGCGLRPHYGAGELPDRAAELDDLWVNMEIEPGESQLQAWRRTYEASPLAKSAEAA